MQSLHAPLSFYDECIQCMAKAGGLSPPGQGFRSNIGNPSGDFGVIDIRLYYINEWKESAPMYSRSIFIGISLSLAFCILVSDPVIAVGGNEKPGPAPGSYLITGEEPVHIPFKIYQNDIMMECEINGVRCQMLIDNGMLMNELMFFGNDTCDSLGFVLEGGVEVGGSGEGEPQMADSASDVTLIFPGIEFTDQPAVVMRKEAGMGNWWPGVEGQVSAVFFKHFVTEIDFDRSLIILHRPESYRYNGGGREIPLQRLADGSWMFPATVQVTRECDPVDRGLTLDLGGVNPVLLFTGERTGIRLPTDAEEKILGYGVQGAIRGHTGRVHSIRIAGYELTDIAAGFQEYDGDANNGETGVIGMPLFQRFNIVFDYPGGRMFLEPGRKFNEPFTGTHR
jgi:hypothetical protein